jgi:hypothetical protein
MQDLDNQEDLEYKSYQNIMMITFVIIVIIFIYTGVKEMKQIYKYSRWVGPFPNVAR